VSTLFNLTFAIGFSDYLVKAYGAGKYIRLYSSGGNYLDVYGKTQNTLIGEYLADLVILFGGN